MGSDRLRPRPRDSERCPYCHDVLLEPAAGEEARCEGCGTLHHAICIAELGRCTVLGCEHPLTADGLGQRPRAEESARTRLLRRRIRERVRGFVREHAQRPASYGAPDPRDLAGQPPPGEARAPDLSEATQSIAWLVLAMAGLPALVLVLFLLYELGVWSLGR